MVVIPSPQLKKQKIMIFVLIGILVATGSILVWGLGGGGFPVPFGVSEKIEEFVPSKVVLRGPEEISREVLEKFENGLEVLDSPKFKVLKKYGDIPVKEGLRGRPNPFVPY